MKRMIPSSKLTIKNDKLTAMEGIYDSEGNQIIADGGSLVVGNPEGTATATLSKISIQNDGEPVVYNVGGTEVEANPQGIVGAVLESIKIGSSNYAIQGGVPNHFDEYHPRLKVDFAAQIITGWTESAQLQLNYGDILWIAYSSESFGASFGCAKVVSHNPREDLTIEISLPVVDNNANSVVAASINLYVDHDDPDETAYITTQNVSGADISIADGTLILY